VLLAEDLARPSRDQADIASLPKQLPLRRGEHRHSDDSEILHHIFVSMTDTMNALFRKDHADKVRRGIRAKKRKAGGEKHAGGEGEPIREDRKINEAGVEIIRRILHELAAGVSLRTIPQLLTTRAFLDLTAACGPTRDQPMMPTTRPKHPDGDAVIRVALYARYSPDLQSPTSIEDQFRECRGAAREGWEVVGGIGVCAVSRARVEGDDPGGEL
jgi:hypothetical protein